MNPPYSNVANMFPLIIVHRNDILFSAYHSNKMCTAVCLAGGTYHSFCHFQFKDHNLIARIIKIISQTEMTQLD